MKRFDDALAVVLVLRQYRGSITLVVALLVRTQGWGKLALPFCKNNFFCFLVVIFAK